MLRPYLSLLYHVALDFIGTMLCEHDTMVLSKVNLLKPRTGSPL